MGRCSQTKEANYVPEPYPVLHHVVRHPSWDGENIGGRAMAKWIVTPIVMFLLWGLLSCNPSNAANWQGPTNPWYEKQKPTDETRRAYSIGWESCCSVADVCADCVVHHVSAKPPWTEGWYYTRNGKTQALPSHIVEYVPYTPTGRPVLFIAPWASGKLLKDEPICLKIPGGNS